MRARNEKQITAYSKSTPSRSYVWTSSNVLLTKVVRLSAVATIEEKYIEPVQPPIVSIALVLYSDVCLAVITQEPYVDTYVIMGRLNKLRQQQLIARLEKNSTVGLREPAKYMSTRTPRGAALDVRESIGYLSVLVPADVLHRELVRIPTGVPRCGHDIIIGGAARAGGRRRGRASATGGAWSCSRNCRLSRLEAAHGRSPCRR